MNPILSLKTPVGRFVRIYDKPLTLLFENEVTPVAQKYTKRYLFNEGFLEQAIDTLDPRPDEQTICFLREIGALM
jgi:hypothetical protein